MNNNNMNQNLKYYLSDHPTIVNFRWSPTQTWFSTWSFLITTITSYLLFSLLLSLGVAIIPPRPRPRPRPLLLALHSLLIAVSSAVIFIGTVLSTATEIHDNDRWLWRSTHLRTTPARWLLCFPPGTRPSGRVFFWSYIFYLSRLYLHLPRTFLKIILRRRPATVSLLLNQSSLLLMSFLWLEFSQSFQVPAILLFTLLYAVVYGYRFWAGIGLRKAQFPFVVNCQVVLVGCNLACHVAVLLLHFFSENKGGCNGIGAWGFNAVCNAIILLLFAKDFDTRVKRSSFDDDSYTMRSTVKEKKRS